MIPHTAGAMRHACVLTCMRHAKITQLTQNGTHVSDYYHKLNSLWKQYDILCKLPTCECDADKKRKEYYNQRKLMKFLMGLDDSYQPVRTTILTSDPFPSVKAIAKLICMLDEKSLPVQNHANMIDSGANQHKTHSDKDFESIIDVSSLNLAVGRPNTTRARVKQIGNLRISDKLVLYGVLVIPEYCVSLLSVYCLFRDNSLFVGFDAYACYILELVTRKTIVTSSVYEGLYVFTNSNKGECNHITKLSNMLSKITRHSRLGHPGDQVLDVLKDELKFIKESDDKQCEVTFFYSEWQVEVRFYENAFPFITMETCFVGNEVTNVNQLNFFDIYESENQVSQCPNDEGKDDLSSDGTRGYLPNDAVSTEHTGSNPTVATLHADKHHPESITETFLQDSDTPGPSFTLRRSQRDTVKPRKFNDYVIEGKVKFGIEKTVNYSNLTSENFYFVTSINKSIEPTTYWEASKFNIGYKARLVAKGYNQRECIDFDETFSPVVKMTTVRCVISLAVTNGWDLYHLDVNNAFLYGDLDEDVYMSLPLGYFSESEKRVCKLKKSLYEISGSSQKQAPRKWNEKLTCDLSEHGFVQSKNDYSLFVKSEKNIFVVLLVYVDDIVITENDVHEIKKFKQFFNSKFLIKDLGVLKYFLGIKVLKTETGICLSQRKYCLELLSQFGLLGCKPAPTPLESGFILNTEKTKSDRTLSNINEYQRLIGKLIYLTLTRPNISYSVHLLSQFIHSPLNSHFKCGLRLLRYLKGAPGLGVHISKSVDMGLVVLVP
ncbi:uncharacterized protein [Rutidosis leptorrhynchoides]|uniref:uncharacterized protein n=1 Tax=Rutidosis leptorrhynchoides TaxID=125765 RepID=UPI003A99FF15